MAGLKEIRTRINSITSTQKITSAMKMVSAAKFHKANETLNRFKPYSRKVFEVLSQIIPSVPESEIAEWFSPRESHKKFALVVLTSNSSMCAGFNQNLLKKIMEDGPSLFQECWSTDDLEVFCLGKKGGDYLSKRGFNIKVDDNLIVNKPRFDEAEKICSSLIERFLSKDLDEVYIAYNQFVNPALQTPTIIKFLPYTLPEKIKMAPTNPNLIFEPNKEGILEILIPSAIKTFFYELVLENSIGEHGARMTAMHQATENAIELIKALKLQYNKARQASITKEILEIVSGAEALKGKGN